MTEIVVAQKPKYECRNAMYFRANDHSGDDIVLVNEKIHYPDGRIESNLRQVRNFQKEIYIHKEGYRKYKQKQVWKPKREMDVYYSTEANLNDAIRKALGIPLGRYMSRRQLCRSPYVYGTDISTSSIVKKKYLDNFPGTVSDATVAVIDIETNVLSGNEEIIAISLSFKDKAIVVTTDDFIGSLPLAEERFFETLDRITPEVRAPRTNNEGRSDTRGCNVIFKIVGSPALAVKEIFKYAHKWRPDFITGWNSTSFDIPKILKALEDEGYDPKDVISDPSVHPRFRTCQYREGKKQQLTASGKHRPLAGYEQWHWLDVPASFFFIDSMCVFYQIRKGGGLEENYKLDTILTKYIGRGKVGIAEAEHLDGVDKHKFMQERYKLEYLVYNLYDCIGVEILDEELNDLSKTFPVLAGVSDFGNYTSNPRRLCDELHFYVQEEEEFSGVIGTVSDQLKTELDSYCPSTSGWIVALATERLIDNGLDVVEEIPGLPTKVHAHSGDIDITSGYPNIEITCNVSKDTTMHEVNSIQGLTNHQQRYIGLNMLGGKVNSLEFAEVVYKLPDPVSTYSKYLEYQDSLKRAA
nr:MAG TPA: DNA POLYMERASE [Caudoviricetes sp.]